MSSRPWRAAAAVFVVAAVWIVLPAAASAQKAGSSSGGQSSGGSHASGGGQSSSGGGGSRGASGGGSHAASGGGSHATPGPGSRAVASGRDIGSRGAVRGPVRPTLNTRPGNGAPIVGVAVPRPPGAVGPPNVLPPGSWYPGWIYGGAGAYYGSSYLWGADPWFGGWGTADWDPYAFYGASGAGSSDDEGALHLKVKPSSANVYVDGYYVGLVDDFDGLFQKLHLEAGPHHIEVRAPGYDTLAFDVRIEANRTTTYKGELKKSP